MQRSTTAWCLAAGFSALIVLTVSLGHRKAGFAGSDRPLEEWNILELAAHLQRSGMNLHLYTVTRHGQVGTSVFLTTQPMEWDDLNRLAKDPSRVAQWDGILFCEQVKGYDPSFMAQQWGENCLWIDPFLFYGDAKLLDGVRRVLASDAPNGSAH